MKIGTKSLLFGAHALWIHPFFVAAAWWRLYGFPWDPRLWFAFFLHDIGYWGKPNMDGPEGETHPELGARLMKAWWDDGFTPHPFRTRALMGCEHWSTFCLLHSRFYSRALNLEPSRLCYADKLAVAMEPWWLYIPRVVATGEIREYVRVNDRREYLAGERTTSARDLSYKQWFLRLRGKMVRFVGRRPK